MTFFPELTPSHSKGAVANNQVNNFPKNRTPVIAPPIKAFLIETIFKLRKYNKGIKAIQIKNSKS